MARFFKSSQLACFFLVILLLCAVGGISLLASVPPVSRDALIHHLALPKLYLEHGRMIELPDYRFSYYPMNLELLYLIPLYFNNDIFPKFIHFFFGLMTAGLVYLYLKRRLNTIYGLLGALIFLTIPIIVRLSSIVYVDLGLIFFSFAAIYCFLRWIEFDFGRRYLIGSAIFCGLALGTKYNGLILLCLMTLFVPFFHARYAPQQPMAAVRTIGKACLFLIIALIVFSPWMIRNYMWRGNPIYPLYNSVFNAETAQAESETGDFEGGHLKFRNIYYHESPLEIILVPIRIFFQGEDNNPKYFDGRLNPFLFFLPFFAFYKFRSDDFPVRREKLIFLFLTILIILIVFFESDMRIRYIGLAIPILAILSVFGLERIRALLSDIGLSKIPAGQYAGNTFLIVILAAFLGINFSYMFSRLSYTKAFAYAKGEISREVYIQEFRPEYAAIQYANKHLPPKAQILALYLGNRRYYFDISVEFDLRLLGEIADQVSDADDFASALQKRAFTHVLVNEAMFDYWSGKTYTPTENELISDFFQNKLKLIYASHGHSLFRITNS